MSTSNFKDIGDALFSGALMAIGVIASRMMLKDVGAEERTVKFKLMSFAMLAEEITTVGYVVKKLQESKVIPEDINDNVSL